MERFWSKVDKTPTCWLWLCYRDHDGYGKFKLNGRMINAHRVSYELLVGPIPDGMEIDHVRDRGCVNRHCVNPSHLEAVSHQVNTLRGGSVIAVNARKTHCKHGHEFTPENTYPWRGNRVCRTCLILRKRRYRSLKRSELAR